jgi:phosphomannomutase
VPEISRFFGIVIAMYHREHEPAHFHARYGSQKVTVRIDDGYVEGHFPPRVRAMLLEWWDRHRNELAENWQLAKELKQIKPIPPLE